MHSIFYDHIHDEMVVTNPFAQAVLTFRGDANGEDPKVLTRPWTLATQTLQLAPFDQIMEVGCSNVETAALMEAAAKENYGRK